MAKNIKIGIKLDKSGFDSELKKILNKNYDIKLDNSSFKKSIDEINKEISKISKNGINISTTIDKNGITSVNKYKDSVAQVTTEVRKNGQVVKQTVTQNIAEFEKMKNQMQKKLSGLMNNQFADSSVVKKLQNQLNSLNMDSSVQSANKLKKAIDDIAKSGEAIQKQTEQRSKLEQDYNNLWQKLLKDRDLKEQQLIEKQLQQRQKAEQEYDNLWQKLLKNREQQSLKEEQRLAEQMANLRERSQIRTSNEDEKNQLAQIKAVNKALEEQYNLQQKAIEKLNNLKSQLQGKLTTASNNNLVDTSTIDKLQQKLNSISTNSSEKEIRELQNAINNLASADGNIVRVQQAIVRLEERINKIKKDKIDLMTPTELGELRQAENELTKLKSTLSSLKSGEIINGKAISSQINTAINSVRTLENSMRELNTTGGSLANTFRDIFSYALGGSGIYLVLNSIREAIDTTVSLDNSLRDLRRVTDLTNNEYSEFMYTANATATALGTTTTEAIDAVTRFSQLGYTFKESSEYLSQYALMLANVADMTADDSSSAIVSVLKGFQMTTSDVVSIVDTINEAGNKFAIDSSGLANALKVGAANLSIAGNDLQQASALIITASEVMQDPVTVSQGLKTISIK